MQYFNDRNQCFHELPIHYVNEVCIKQHFHMKSSCFPWHSNKNCLRKLNNQFKMYVKAMPANADWEHSDNVMCPEKYSREMEMKGLVQSLESIIERWKWRD